MSCCHIVELLGNDDPCLTVDRIITGAYERLQNESSRYLKTQQVVFFMDHCDETTRPRVAVCSSPPGQGSRQRNVKHPRRCGLNVRAAARRVIWACIASTESSVHLNGYYPARRPSARNASPSSSTKLLSAPVHGCGRSTASGQPFVGGVHQSWYHLRRKQGR